MRISCACIIGVATAVLIGTAEEANSAMITATDDTILLNNGGNGQAEQNYGGRTEIILGPNSGNPRDALIRFDVTSFASQINAGLNVKRATLTLYERSSRNGTQPAGPTTFSVQPLVSGNAGWVEGTASGAGGGLQGQLGSVSRLYLATPSSATPDGGPADDGLQWFSAGGGATSDTIPTQFAPGTDTRAELGAADLTSDGSNDNETWEIELDRPGLKALLPGWLADPNGNPGLAIIQTGGAGGQWFFGSIESVEDSTDPAITLHLEFVPEPSSVLLIGLAGLGMVVVRMGYRIG